MAYISAELDLELEDGGGNIEEKFEKGANPREGGGMKRPQQHQQKTAQPKTPPGPPKEMTVRRKMYCLPQLLSHGIVHWVREAIQADKYLSDW